MRELYGLRVSMSTHEQDKRAEEALKLLEQRGYVEQIGNGHRLTPEWVNVYSTAMRLATERTEKPPWEVRDQAIIEAILYKGPANREDIVYMTVGILALARTGAVRMT